MSTGLASDITLKTQYQTLQEQQHQKLLRRKQRKEEKIKEQETRNADTRDTASSRAFGIDDNLDLELAEPSTSNSIYSEELVTHLNEQIRELKDESGRLYKLLSERDLELRQLRKKRDADKVALHAGGGASDTASSKIVELSKKVREMTAELESERTKTKQLTKRCLDLEKEMSVAGSREGTGTTNKNSSFTGESDTQINEAEMKSLQDKLNKTELRVSEFRNQCQTLKQELKTAHKVLSQEIGEDVNISSLLNSPGTWRGRSQQVLTLQKKVSDLKAELSKHDRDGDDLEKEFMGSATTRSSRSHIEDRHKDQLKKMDKDRKESHEKMSNELKALEVDHEAVKNKLDAAKARNKVVVTELKSVKQQMQTLLEKGKHDDELISALFKQQEQMKRLMEDTGKRQKETEQQKESRMRELAMKTQQDNNVVEQLKAIVAEREAKVHHLEEEIRQLRLSNLQKAQMNGVNGLFERAASSQSMVSSSRPVSSPVRGNTELEITEYTSPTPTSAPPSGRISSRQAVAEKITSARNSARQKPQISEADQAALEELNRQCHELKTLYQATQVEKEKLSELVQLLQTRIAEATERVVDAQSELQMQKRKNVQLEKQIGKVKVEQNQSGSRKSGKGKSTTNLRESVLLDEDNDFNMEELQTNLDIQRDENAALKAALQSTLQAKEQDLKLYSDAIETTKMVFLQGLRQARQS